MNYRLWGTLLVSVLVHGALLRGVAAPDTEPPEVAVEAGKTSIAIKMQKQKKEKKKEQPEEPTESRSEPEPKPEKTEPEKPKEKPEKNEPQEKKEPEQQKEPETEKESTEKSKEKKEEKKAKETTPSQKQTGARMVEPAEYRSNPSPEYPSVSRRRGEEGTVMLRVRVGTDGEPITVTVEESSGYQRLDDAARKTVHEWSFEPAREGSRKVRSTVRVPVRFQID